MPQTETWRRTTIWSTLARRRSESGRLTREVLPNLLDSLEAVLSKGATSPEDFTLHDQDHSFRVAEWQARLIPQGVLGRLSAYELSLALLASYAHDIGMTPGRGLVQGHYEFLLTGASPALCGEDIELFRAWLDMMSVSDVPLPDSGTSFERVRLACCLTAQYVREQHNAWSAEWLRRTFSGMKLGTYANSGSRIWSYCAQAITMDMTFSGPTG